MAPAERKAVRISRAPEAASSRAKHASASEARESAIAASNRPSSSAIEVAQLISAADGITSDVSSEWTEVTEGPACTARSMSVPKSAWSPASSAASPNRAASASTAMRGSSASALALISRAAPRRRPSILKSWASTCKSSFLDNESMHSFPPNSVQNWIGIFHVSLFVSVRVPLLSVPQRSRPRSS